MDNQDFQVKLQKIKDSLGIYEVLDKYNDMIKKENKTMHPNCFLVTVKRVADNYFSNLKPDDVKNMDPEVKILSSVDIKSGKMGTYLHTIRHIDIIKKGTTKDNDYIPVWAKICIIEYKDPKTAENKKSIMGQVINLGIEFLDFAAHFLRSAIRYSGTTPKTEKALKGIYAFQDGTFKDNYLYAYTGLDVAEKEIRVRIISNNGVIVSPFDINMHSHIIGENNKNAKYSEILIECSLINVNDSDIFNLKAKVKEIIYRDTNENITSNMLHMNILDEDKIKDNETKSNKGSNEDVEDNNEDPADIDDILASEN